MADKTWGLLAEFPNPAKLLEAAQKTRDAGYKEFETWSPFPVHGMDEAMGIGSSKVPWIVLAGGLLGMTTAVLLQWWSGAVEYPIVIGGKDLFSWEFALPVTFELSVLFSAFGAVFGMFILNKLPKPYHPLDRVPLFRRVTDDKFFLTIETRDPKFDMDASKAFLAELGGTNITVVEG